jgi:hypothetical protein
VAGAAGEGPQQVGEAVAAEAQLRRPGPHRRARRAQRATVLVPIELALLRPLQQRPQQHRPRKQLRQHWTIWLQQHSRQPRRWWARRV